MVKFRNPLGPGEEYVGPWSLSGSTEWDNVSPEEKARIGLKYLADGEFFMPFTEFIKTFTHLEVVHLDKDTSRDEPSLKGKNTWQLKLYQGAWRKGVSAGGCRNNSG